MRSELRPLAVGLGMIFGSILLDLVGSSLQSLTVLIASFAIGVAGAVIALRGIIEFVAERG